MSKLLMGGILGVLLVLLGIMSYMVSPHPPPAPDPKEMARQQKAHSEAEIKQQQEAMKAQMTAKSQGKPGSKIESMKAAGRLPAPPKGAAPGPKGMDISSAWMKHRKPGEEGLKELEVRQKQEQNALPPVQMPPTAK
jgi:hypothetical protein